MKFANPKLNDAFIIAEQYHNTQVDKAGMPYIEHIITVVDNLVFYLDVNNEDVLVAGMLHDVLEDTKMSVEKLISLGISKSAIELIKLVTRTENNNKEYYKNIAKNDKATLIKIADLQSNTEYYRLKRLDKITINKLVNKYKNAINELIKNSNNIRNITFLDNLLLRLEKNINRIDEENITGDML